MVSSTDNRGSNRIETRLVDEGAMLPSSSSKDDDILSESSNEVETLAMQTLDNISEQVGCDATARALSKLPQMLSIFYR
uniref:BLOC-1-related complex subunit 7 n=1 Tax=Ascaris lumbricoides TaxID=6252 RepID=A0A0M3I9X8_ASCLU